MSNLTILNSSIRTYENLYSLTDLHRASGAENKHKPSFFLRNDQTKDLIAEIEQESELQNCNSVKIIHGGVNSGTYACEELVLAYAMWISPKFHLIVLRAFIAMHKGEVKSKQLALPEPKPTIIYPFELTEEELQKLAWTWVALKFSLEVLERVAPPLQALGSYLGPTAHSHALEYGRNLRDAQPIFDKLTSNFETTNWADTNWNRTLPHIRHYSKKHEKKRAINLIRE